MLIHTKGLQQSEAITDFFKELSLQLMQTPFPKKLVNYLHSFKATDQVEQVQEMMTSVLHVTDKHSMENFLCTYMCKVSTDDQKHDDLIAYLSARSFHEHLDKATHLDVKDMVKALKRGVLEQLCYLVQCSQAEVLDMKENCQEIKKQLTSYEWVSRLSRVKADVNQLLKHKGLSVRVLKKIGLDRAVVKHLSASDFHKLLRFYGVMKWELSNNRKHRVLTFKAANISLNDILNNPKLAKLFEGIDEFWFLCTECFYMDASINASTDAVWSSKNVAISAPKIIVKGDCLFDLSGKDGVDGERATGKRKADDGAKPGAHGCHGEHGTPGQSGGNILICTDGIINSELLSLRSCGGNGGNGRDGGDGRDGKAKPSASDGLGSWPKNFARYWNKPTLKSQQEIIKNIKSSGFEIKGRITASKFAHCVCSDAPNHGVQVLFATVDDFCHRYGFLLSLSKDGESADGGAAGTGGKGGGGGKAGVIDVVRVDGHPNSHHDIKHLERHNGQDGRPGKTGKPGKRAIAERLPDHLYVDGAGPWGTTEEHHVFIDIKPWKQSPKTGELGSGRYYCKHEVLNLLRNKSINTTEDHVGFFRVTRASQCLTRYNRKAVDGTVKNQDEITETTRTKAIDHAAVNIEYQLFANQTLALQDRSALLQSLEQLEHKLHEELHELETVHEQQYHKQRRHANYQSMTTSVDTVDAKPASQSTMTEEAIPFERDKLETVVKDNPLISPEDIEFIKSNVHTIQDKYVKVKTIIQSQLDGLHRQVLTESGAKEQDTSRFNIFGRTKTLSQSSSYYICRMLDALLVPIVHVMHFEHVQAVDSAIQFVTTIRKNCHSKFHDEMDEVKATIDHLLVKKHRWCVLAEIYFKLIVKMPDTDLLTYQCMAVTVYQKVIEMKTVEELKQYVSSLDDECDIHPYSEPLPSYSTSCDEIMPLGRSTQNALELLMLFINDINSEIVYIPDILSAVQEEYVTFHSTISDSDLQFIMTLLQDKLLNLIDKTHLEDLFCDRLLSSLKGNTLKEGHFILYNGLTYQIDDINRQDDTIAINIKCRQEWHVIKVDALDQVTVDGSSIAFPNDELLASPISVDEMWSQLQRTVMKGRRIIADDKGLEDAIKLPYGVHNECKQQLISILQEARSAQDIPYDVFSFYLPSQWVEQLILYAVRTQYQDQDPNFVADVQQAISGLSSCIDKTLYCTFYNQFLTFKNDHMHCTIDILEVLQLLKSIFIDCQLCTLVTQQGISQAWPHMSAEVIFTDLQDTHLIDDAGTFLEDVTMDTIHTFCRARSLQSPVYLENMHSMQQYLNSLTDKELTFWNHKLHEIELRLQLQDIVESNVDDSISDEMLMYAQMLVCHYGKDLVSKLMLALNSKADKVNAASLLELFKKCAYKTWIFDVVIEELKSCDAISVIIQRLQAYEWESVFSKSRCAVDIIASIKLQFTEEVSPKLDAITTILNNIEDIENNRKCSTLDIIVQVPICEFGKDNIKEWAEAFRKSACQFNRQAFFDNPLFAEAFAVIRRGITIFYDTEKGKKRIIPRDNQMVASLLFLQNLSMQGGASQGTRLMQQISTGEGKTMIICMTAIFKALQGEKADIVTSSSVLATRDAAEQKGLYDLFDISVSHCCHEELSKRREAYECDVVYGDIGSFQRDILETNFYGRMIRTNHDFDNVIIDEVDSMLVDKGETMLYLPHALPDLNALQNIYLEIWSLVNAQDFLGFPDEQNQLHDYLKHKLFGGLCANAFTAISDISEEQSAAIHRKCVAIGLINDDDHCLTTDNIKEIKDKIDTINVVSPHLRQEIMLIIQEHLQSIPIMQEIPKALHPFTRRSLKAWIHSAVNAKYFRPNKEYIIDIDRRESAADRYPRIIIMDNETGVEQESSEWGSGLHQFLQLKHYLRLSTESLKAVYMSNISFFTARYTNIMGVSGTLGSNAEHNLFSRLYKNTKIVVLPTNKPSRLQIDAPQCCSTKESWEEAIYADVRKKHQQGRAVLLICEDVEWAKYLNEHFRQSNPKIDLTLYVSSHQQNLEETGEIIAGQLIIATNLAGRGTDIKLNEAVKHNGGLHVCLSYLPPNVRVEQQAYGRAARSGDRGSCKLIFCNKDGDLSYAIRKRDLHEAQRIADVEADYYHNIKFQEELFKMFSGEYEVLKNKHQDQPDGRPILDNCLDCWAYFLDEYTDAIESIPMKVTKAKMEKDRIRRAFVNNVKRKAFVEVTLSPARMMQKGHTYMKQAVKVGHKYKDAGNKVDYKKAIKAYEEAITQNPGDPFAKYYIAAAKLNEAFRSKNTTTNPGKIDRHKFKQLLYQIIPLFHDKIKQCQAQITTLQLANRHQDQSLTAGVLYYNEQKQHEIEVYHQYLESIQDIIGRGITPNTFDHADWKEETSVVFKTVKKMFLLKECRVSPRYLPRLKALLQKETGYRTFESKINNKMDSLLNKQSLVEIDDFRGVFPDKHHFWDQLKHHHLLTHLSTTKEGQIGYWNPSVNIKHIQFGSWDCINSESFDWISGLSSCHKDILIWYLRKKQVLNPI